MITWDSMRHKPESFGPQNGNACLFCKRTFKVSGKDVNALGRIEVQDKTDIRVFISSRESRCDECGEDVGRGAWITLKEDKGALCLSCSDLDHLAFLPSGDACLSRRAKKNSVLWAVVLKWRHTETKYDQLLGQGYDRHDARTEVQARLKDILDRWSLSVKP
jgi:hypothetical protein